MTVTMGTGVLMILLFAGQVYGAIVFTQNMNNLVLREDVGIGEPVYTLRANQIGNPNTVIIYGFNNRDSVLDNTITDSTTYFRIDQNTGQVNTTGEKFDYENMQLPINLKIIARTVDGDDFTKITSTISVTNINDEKPIFLNGSLNINVTENAAVPLDGQVYLTNIYINDTDNIITSSAETGFQQYLEVNVQHCLIDKIQVPCSDKFELRRTSPRSSFRWLGEFIVKAPLDYEEASIIQVQLLAKDGESKNNVNTDVTVTVVDQQDSPPIWKILPYNNEAMDNTTAGSFSVRVVAEDQDTGKRPIFYTIVAGQELDGVPIDAVWQIDGRTGIITNKITLDLEDETYFRNYEAKTIRENWLIVLKACEIISVNPLVVGTEVVDCSQPGPINIKINDINDNGPKFTQNTYEYTIREDVRDETLLDIPLIEIIDRDTDVFAKFNSTFIQPSAEFKIVQPTFTNPVVSVRNTNLIDYDKGPRTYTLLMRTFDLDTSVRYSSTATIIIHIQDVNDQKPEFQFPTGEDSYSAFVYENATEGTPVITLLATDGDSGIMGDEGIVYRILSTATAGSSQRELFVINDLGQVSVASCELVNGAPGYGIAPCIDYDTPPQSHDLVIRALDTNGHSSGKNSLANLKITILDVNDNVPTIKDDNRTIFENKRVFSPPLLAQGDDKDSGSVLRYSIISETPIRPTGRIWTIDPETGAITVNKPNGDGVKFNDGDKDGKFELEVQVTDGVNSAKGKIYIYVIDTNDNAPVFLPDRFTEFINETIPGGTFVLNVKAEDLDDPTSENGKLEYNIVSGGDGKFFIDRHGEISTATEARFDFNIKRQYIMTVVASDGGTPQLSGIALVTINVLDQNNKDPVITPFLQKFIVYENAQINSPIGTVNASDPDADAILRFDFTGSFQAWSDEGYEIDFQIFDFRDMFKIDNTTGRIYVNKELDSKKVKLLSIGVVVYDVKTTPPQEGFGQIFIEVLPFNTQPPRFQPFQSPIYMDEEQVNGAVVVSLIAIDNNAIRDFAIYEQPHDFFYIDPNTGTVTIQSRMDYDNFRMINDSYFKVIVTDMGVPALTGTTSVSVIFRNINDNVPVFLDRPLGDKVNLYSHTMLEHEPVGTNVIQVFAKDDDRPDENGYDDIRFYMTDDRFDIHPLTGWITVADSDALDREINSNIVTSVIARDNPVFNTSNSKEVQNQRVAYVYITLTDINDNPPRFTSDKRFIFVYETISVTKNILQLFSTDLDIGNHAIPYYTKNNVGTDFNDLFGVRLITGQVFVQKSLVGHVGTYAFDVQAQDNLGTGFKAYTKVTIEVRPSANSAPRWVRPPRENMTLHVLEEQYNGMLVYDCLARDTDTGNNGRIDYSFIYNGVDVEKTPDFRINRVTGVIQAERVYDRETVPRYVLLLKATDNGETPLQSTRFLTIVIKDVNDNAPTFDINDIEFRVSEDENVNYLVGIVTATDLDLDPQIYYNIIAGNEEGVFVLGERDGTIRLAKTLDAENKGVYYLDIQASNNEPDYTVIRNRRRRATDPSIITVRILVGDVNDQAPVFLQTPYVGCISTRAAYDEHILKVLAIDYDAVGTGVVRYNITDGNIRNGNTIFDIHPRFGVITNMRLMRSYSDQSFSLTVNARDGEDVTSSVSTNQEALIFVTPTGKEVKMLVKQNTADVRLILSQIKKSFEEASDLTYLCEHQVADHVFDSAGSVSTLWSDLYLSGIRGVRNSDGSMRYEILSGTETANIINREIKGPRASIFNLFGIQEVEVASSSETLDLDDQSILIILIIIAILIFLVIVFCIVAFMCIRAAKRQKKQLLLHKTNATPAPVMIVQERIQHVEPEPVIYDNRAYVVEQPEPPRVVEQKVYETDPVHVQYAVVSKVSRDVEYRPATPEPVDQGDVIVVGLRDNDEPVQHVVYESGEPVQHVVYESGEPEYRIETEVEQD